MKTIGKALILFAHHHGFVLAYQGREVLHDAVLDKGGGLDEFDLEATGTRYPLNALKDGLYIGGIVISDPPDLELTIVELRPATEEEWERHCAGEWPWETWQG